MQKNTKYPKLFHGSDFLYVLVIINKIIINEFENTLLLATIVHKWVLENALEKLTEMIGTTLE